MEKLKPRTLSGFMELLPAPQQKFERMLEILRKNFALYGFTPIDTPIIESAEILLAKGGGETEKQIYRFQKGDSDLALRFDHTVPLAKYVALHENELCFPFRRYAIGKVYRGERAQRGRFREFYQADIDIIGDGKLSVVNEAEIPSIIYKVFSEFGLKRFCISVNNRKILNGFYAMLGLTEKSGDIMRTVDKLDKIGPDKVRVILVEDIGLSEQDADEILRFIAIRGTNAEVLERLEAYRGRDEAFDTGLDELTTVTKYLAAFGVPEAVTGAVLAAVSAVILLGGLKRVAAVAERLVPAMALLYFGGALTVVGVHITAVPAALAAIVKGAFGLRAAGGGIVGYGLSRAVTWGFKRGAFSNEAGLGSSVMVHAASNVKEPVQQGMWGIFEVFADTMVVCTLTALVVLTSGFVDLDTGRIAAGAAGSALVGQAFDAVFGTLGSKLIAVCILLFAYSTTLGWSCYGCRAVEYLFGAGAGAGYRVLFVALMPLGAVMRLDLAWTLSDTFNGLMMLPNLIGVVALSGTVVRITQNYLARKLHGSPAPPLLSAGETI